MTKEKIIITFSFLFGLLMFGFAFLVIDPFDWYEDAFELEHRILNEEFDTLGCQNEWKNKYTRCIMNNTAYEIYFEYVAWNETVEVYIIK